MEKWSPEWKAAALEELYQEWEDCDRCGLCETRMNVVFGEGNPDADILFVGEAPGEDEDDELVLQREINESSEHGELASVLMRLRVELPPVLLRLDAVTHGGRCNELHLAFGAEASLVSHNVGVGGHRAGVERGQLHHLRIALFAVRIPLLPEFFGLRAMPSSKDVLTTGEVAKICNVAPRTVSKWFDSGQLRGYRIPGSKDRRIPVAQLVRFMKAHHTTGSIVNIISDCAHGGYPFLTAYSASKGALATLTKNVAHALRYDRIRVNGICIGWMYTPHEHQVQVESGQPENWLELVEADKPFKRLLRPRDVAYLTAYLLSDRSDMMTGSLIDFDQKVIGGLD